MGNGSKEKGNAHEIAMIARAFSVVSSWRLEPLFGVQDDRAASMMPTFGTRSLPRRSVMMGEVWRCYINMTASVSNGIFDERHDFEFVRMIVAFGRRSLKIMDMPITYRVRAGRNAGEFVKVSFIGVGSERQSMGMVVWTFGDRPICDGSESMIVRIVFGLRYHQAS